MKSQNIEDIFPLSPTQEGMLFHSLYSPESGDYVSQVLCTLEIPDREMFEQVLQATVARQPMMRSAIAWRKSKQPVQVIGRKVRVPVEHLDWRHLEDREYAERLHQKVLADRSQGFVFTRAPLARITLVRRREAVYDFLWSYHHLLLDGWSVPLVIRDLFELYGAFEEGREPEASKARPYRDFIGWLKRQDKSLAAAYWQRQLAGLEQATPLPLAGGSKGLGPSRSHESAEDMADGASRAAKGSVEDLESRLEIRLSPEQTESLDAFGRSRRLTLNTLVQAAWALLLARFSGRQNVVFGVTLSGRPADLPGVESMVGLFINTLPVHLRVEPDTPLHRWLDQLQRGQVDLRRFEYSSLAEVQTWSGFPKGQGLFESIVVFENYPVDRAVLELGTQGGGLRVLSAKGLSQTHYPLTLVALPGDSLALQLLYDPQRFGELEIRRLLRGVKDLLVAMVEAPEAPLSTLLTLGPVEAQRLREWNDRPLSPGAPVRQVSEILRNQALEIPEEPAVIAQDGTLTFRQLNQRADHLARTLRSLGVGRETVVGLYLDRSLELIVGLFGILKAGAAYLPLDTKEPKERLAFFLEDARVPVVVSRGDLTQDLPEAAPKVLLVDDLASPPPNSTSESGKAQPEVQAQDEESPLSEAEDHLAYVIYTSGSTGRPKGVGISHRSLWNYLQAVRNVVVDESAFRLPLLTRLSFDASLRQVFCPLLLGRPIHVLSEETATRPDALLLDLSSREQGVLSCVPSLWRAVLDEIETREIPAPVQQLRRLILGGEEVTRDLLLRTRAQFPHLEVWNFYGPTETTVNASFTRLDRGRPITIGRPVARTHILTVDPTLRVLPPGSAGEMVVGGEAVARGYLHQPRLTAERLCHCKKKRNTFAISLI